MTAASSAISRQVSTMATATLPRSGRCPLVGAMAPLPPHRAGPLAGEVRARLGHEVVDVLERAAHLNLGAVVVVGLNPPDDELDHVRAERVEVEVLLVGGLPGVDRH